MNTRQITAEYREAHWVQIMQERRESGQSIRAYCKGAGIHENVYYYWQRKLREAASKPFVSAEMQTTGFTQVELTAISESSAQSTGEIRLQVGEIDVIADSAYPADKLAALIRELGRPC